MSPWISVADTPPPSGVRLLIAYNPAHFAPAVNIAKLESGRGWYADGHRQPAPVWWMPIPALPHLI
jgi:hypothetical protein